jgi:cell shape-determining protein MreD
MKKALWILFGILLVAFQSSLSAVIPMEFSKPDMGVPFLVFATFFFSPIEGLLTAILFAFTQELFSNGPTGTMLFTKVAIFVACTFLKGRLYIDSRYTFSFVTTCMVLLEAAIFLALSLAAKGETRNIVNVLVYAVPNAIITGFIALFLFSLFERVKVRS